MSKNNTAPSGTIEPERLYSYDELAGFIGGVTGRRVRRWVEEGRLDYTLLPSGRGRRISGQQWLDFIKKNAVEATN